MVKFEIGDKVRRRSNQDTPTMVVVGFQESGGVVCEWNDPVAGKIKVGYQASMLEHIENGGEL